MVGDAVFLTGATGFIGGHVLAELLRSGYRVRALARTPVSRMLPVSEKLTIVEGDVTRAGELVDSLRGCRYLCHAAAAYSFSPRDRAAAVFTNVAGTKSLLEAARIAGVEKIVMTSSSATVGPQRNGTPATEDNIASILGHASEYHRSKVLQERVALAARMPVTLILPTTPIGPGDWKPTPTGKMVVDFMKGRIKATLPGGLNVVPVEDVARAHVLALEKGRGNRRYLIGGVNLTLEQLWARLAVTCGRPAPRFLMPFPVALGLAWCDEIRCRILPKTPLVPLEGVYMGREKMFVSTVRAQQELGFSASSVTAALERAVSWYRDNGYAR